ncbi:oxygen-regulated protein 1-like [Gastrophryne carolinensis]
MKLRYYFDTTTSVKDSMVAKFLIPGASQSEEKANDPVFSPNSLEYSQSSANVCHKDDNLLEFPHTPDNEICLTEHWPHSGEELPVISPGDNIEKTVHLNSDGTMTVEMKVRFKIREEETINWSTTVSRADISYCKKKLLCTSVNPVNKIVDARDIAISNANFDEKIHKGHEMTYRCETQVEKMQKQVKDDDININKSRKTSSRKEKSNFYRPPTPGIRRGQELRASTRRASEDNLQEIMKQLFSYQEMEHEMSQSVDDIVNDCNTQMLTTLNNVDSNGAYQKQDICHKEAKRLAKVSEDSFELLETTHMELSERDTVYEKDLRSSLKSNYTYASGSSKLVRPHSAGKRMFQQEQFRFKEIKRSASVAYNEPSITHEKTNMKRDVGIAYKKHLETEPQKKSVTLMAKISATKADRDADLPSKNKIETQSENETTASSDNYHTSSLTQKKKIKKKTAGESIKHIPTNIPNHDPTALNAQQPDYDILCLNMNRETKNIALEEIPPHLSTDQPELGIIRKLKGGKKMAKVKPSSVKAQHEVLPHNKNIAETEKHEENTKQDTTGCSEHSMPNGSILDEKNQSECLSTQHSTVSNEQPPKKNTKTSKRSQKIRKNIKHSKKKTNINKTIESKLASASHGIDSENVTPPMLTNMLESYVQNWLNKIFPNTTLPMLQMISSTMLDNNEGDQKYTDREDTGPNENTDQTHKDDAQPVQEKHEQETAYRETTAENQHVTQQNFVDSVLKEKSNDLAELFLQQFKGASYNNSHEKYKPEELIKLLASSLPLTKPGIDAAIQVEDNTSKLTDCINSYAQDVLKEQFKMSSQNKPKRIYLEKSMSLPNATMQESHSSSPQLLLAWLIILYLKQGMYHMAEGLSEHSSDCSVIFNLLQSLKKIAIAEHADDLKAAILHVQELAVKFDTAMKIIPNDCTINCELPKNNYVSKMPIESVQINFIDANTTAPEKQPVKCNGSDDDMDDLRFFSTLPYRELSNECCRSETGDCLDQCNVLQLHENQIYASTELQVKSELKSQATSEQGVLDLSQRYIDSSVHNVINENVHNIESSANTLNTCKVKMMVQKIEQRNYTSGSSEHPKALQSPISSDGSDYRQDSEESMSDEFRASSEIMTESGEEQIHEKPMKAGFVKRAMERLYGKVETKIILPKRKVSPIQMQPKQSASGNVEHTSFKENMFRSLSSPCTKIHNRADCLKSASMPLLEADEDQDCLISQSGTIPNITLSSQTKSMSSGVLIDKGRWLLKENHLVRRSPPEAPGMYGNLDTTSAETCFDNTSEDMPYLHSACKSNQPLAEISSSELEDMAKPQSYSCRYFSMPHASDSEPFNDTFSSKTKARPKSSSDFVKDKTQTSRDSMVKSGEKSGSLPSFATVDFHFSENKIHPVPQSDIENTSHANSSGANQRQVQEQDSLDKIQFVCGQHCPILSAIIYPVNERNRGFVYRSPYDFENQLLHTVSMNFTPIKLLNNYLFLDENNNICNMNFLDVVDSSNDTDACRHFIEYKNVSCAINLLRIGREDRKYFRPSLIWNHDDAEHEPSETTFSTLNQIGSFGNNSQTDYFNKDHPFCPLSALYNLLRLHYIFIELG